MRKLIGVLLALQISACAEQPVAVTTSSHVDVPKSAPVPARIDCRSRLSKDNELSLSLVLQRAREGGYYAALAQIRALPEDNAAVAIAHADILRHVNPDEAERWYEVLVDTCMSGFAEHGLGLLAAQRNDYRRAQTHVAVAAEALPTNARIRNDLGFIDMHLGLDNNAEFELRTASELATEDRLPLFNLMLLSLLRADNASWLQWRARLQPDDNERRQLDRSCRTLMTLRAFYKAGTKPPATDVLRCPIMP